MDYYELPVSELDLNVLKASAGVAIDTRWPWRVTVFLRFDDFEEQDARNRTGAVILDSEKALQYIKDISIRAAECGPVIKNNGSWEKRIRFIRYQENTFVLVGNNYNPLYQISDLGIRFIDKEDHPFIPYDPL